MYIIDPKSPDQLVIRLEGSRKEEIIPSLQAIPRLKEVGDHLYFNGKHLVCDFFGKVEFYYRVEVLEGSKIKVSGRLKWREYDIDIRDCDWIGAGKPHWFIKGISLKLIATHVSWKRLKQVYQTENLILSGEEKTDFLEELDPDDPDCPQVVMLGGSLEQVNEPLPVLVLKDRLGAFADLWMDYGGQRVAFHDHMTKMKRNQNSEKNWEKDLLETAFIKKEMATSHYYCPIDKIAKSLSFLLEIGWHINDWKGNRILKQGKMDLDLQQQTNQILSVRGQVHYDQYQADISEMVGAFNRRDRFIQLGEGFSGLIEDQADWQELAEEGEVVGNEIRVKRSHLGVFESLPIPALANLKDRLQNFTHIEEALPSESFKGQLRPYQQQGVNWLNFLIEYGFHGILADDMGLGKTVQVLAWLSRISINQPHLIVVPTSLLFNWKNEFEKFLPTFTLYTHHGSQRAKNSVELSKHRFILTSYATLRYDLPLLQQLTYGCLILDEAQMIKNAHAQTSQAVCTLQAQVRLSITGTPLENHLGEIWSHFRFLIPDLFGDEESFFADLQAAESDSRYLKRMQKKIAPFILRRKKEEVAKDLPERIDQVVWVEMNEEQRRFYDRFLASVKGNLIKKVQADGVGKHRMEIFESILRLRQICCHPMLLSSLYDAEEAIPSSAKFDFVMDDLETLLEENRKVLVYSQFTSMLQLMVKEANKRGWAHAYLDGSSVNREKIVASFQDDPAIRLFFISLKAGGVGLNLTKADYVFLYDPWWNNAVEEQAINRAHRIGRKDTVVAKRFVTVESIEERMMKLKAAKQSLVGELFDEEAILSHLTAEDLFALIQEEMR